MEAILELIVTWPIELSVAVGIPLLLEVVDLHVLEFKAVAQPEGVEVRGGGEGGGEAWRRGEREGDSVENERVKGESEERTRECSQRARAPCSV